MGKILGLLPKFEQSQQKKTTSPALPLTKLIPKKRFGLKRVGKQEGTVGVENQLSGKKKGSKRVFTQSEERQRQREGVVYLRI